LRFACAGHPSPFRIRRDRGVVEPLKVYDPRHGPALGLFEQAQYPICHAPMAANDLFLLFTDGVYEINAETEEEFGQERLLKAVQQRSHLPPDKLFDELLAEARAFAQREDFDDDVCLVACEVTRLEKGR
jgi:phosphoserine phosphatase RsbU/P